MSVSIGTNIHISITMNIIIGIRRSITVHTSTSILHIRISINVSVTIREYVLVFAGVSKLMLNIDISIGISIGESSRINTNFHTMIVFSGRFVVVLLLTFVLKFTSALELV